MNKRKTYSKEFKREAVRQLEQGNKFPGELAIELGIRRTMLYKWQAQQKKYSEHAFRGSARKPDSELDEVARLRKELAWVKEERDILIKAAAYLCP